MATTAPSPRVAAGRRDPEIVRQAASFSDALSEMIRVVQFRDRDRACCHELSVSQCYALKGLVDHGGLTVNDLAAHLYLDKSTASRVAQGLVDKSLAARRRDPEDGRVVRVVATEAGQRVCALIESDLASEYADLLAEFEPEVREAMSRLLRRLARSFAARVETSGGTCCVVR